MYRPTGTLKHTKIYLCDSLDIAKVSFPAKNGSNFEFQNDSFKTTVIANPSDIAVDFQMGAILCDISVELFTVN